MNKFIFARKWEIILLALIMAIAGCAQMNILDHGPFTSTETINYPAIGSAVSSGLGERLAAKGVRITGNSLRIRKPTLFNQKEGLRGGCSMLVDPVSAFKTDAREIKGEIYDCYGSMTALKVNDDGTTNWNCGGLYPYPQPVCRRRSDGRISYIGIGLDPKDYEKIEFGELSVDRPDNFAQEIIYNGRVGDNVKFVYREFSGDIIRPAFTQEVQYDLSESIVIGFKGLRIRVISATNTEITYELLSNF